VGLIRRGRHWWLDIRIKGQRIRRSLHTKDKSLALARYGQKKEELESEFGLKVVKFVHFCDKYIEWAWASKPLSAKREQQRLRKIVQFLVEVCKIVYLDDISPYHIEQLKGELRGRGLAKITVNRYLQILRGLFYRAIDWEVYSKPNPTRKVRFYREETAVQPLSREEMERVLRAAKAISDKPRSPLQKAFYDICSLAVNTGMRKSEILGLTWKSVKGDTVEITGKGGKRRTIPLNELSRNIILKRPRNSEYVFDLPNRHQVNIFERTVEQIRKRTGVHFTFHHTRHFFATSLLEKGVDIVTAASLLGHSKTATSLIYTHTDSEKKKKAVDLLVT